MKLRNVLLLVGLPLGLAALGFAIPNASAQILTNLYWFRQNSGVNPHTGLVQGTDGNFYGTTESGGTGDVGTVFRISPSGSFTNLYIFSGGDGANPLAALVQGSDGNFYGTTYGGGASMKCSGFSGGPPTVGCGTVFRISPSGTFTNLYSFTGGSDGGNPWAGLAQGSDGNFYGATPAGGTNGVGNVFRISPSGAFTNLYSFTGGNDGANPLGALMQASDGNFYGTTKGGGTNGDGTVYQITPSGALTSLHSFIGSDGASPASWLVQGNDGNLYGTTVSGSYRFYLGTVFRISPSGSFTNLHSFSGPGDGYAPFAGLVLGSDGNFYGTTFSIFETPLQGNGTLFRISSSGVFTNLYSFPGPLAPGGIDGADPYGGLVQGTDGNFYGTTEFGGPGLNGTVFKLTVPLNPPANQISEIQFFNVLDSTIVALPIPSVAGETYQLQYSDSMSPTNWLNTGGTITSIGGPLVLIDLAEPLPSQRFYRAVITP
jgi:uncharacterized repeat protein (TIGR03803 family)